MRTKKGVITSAKMTGTATVTVHRHAVHPKYRKRYRISKKYLVDTKNFKDLYEGDEVLIEECKPISKNKYFKVIEVVKQAARVSELNEEEGLDTAMNRLGQEEEKVQSEKEEDKKEEAETKPLAQPSPQDSAGQVVAAKGDDNNEDFPDKE